MELRLSPIEQKAEARQRLASNQPEQAVGILQPLVESCPDDPEAQGWLGVALSMSGDYEGAIQRLQQAAILEPDEASYPFNAGAVFERLGSRDKAIAAYVRAVQLDPTYPRAAESLQRLTGTLDFPENVEIWPETPGGKSGSSQASVAPLAAGGQARGNGHDVGRSPGAATTGAQSSSADSAADPAVRTSSLMGTLAGLVAAGFAISALIWPELAKSSRGGTDNLVLLMGMILFVGGLAIAYRFVSGLRQ